MLCYVMLCYESLNDNFSYSNINNRDMTAMWISEVRPVLLLLVYGFEILYDDKCKRMWLFLPIFSWKTNLCNHCMNHTDNDYLVARLFWVDSGFGIIC